MKPPLPEEAPAPVTASLQCQPQHDEPSWIASDYSALKHWLPTINDRHDHFERTLAEICMAEGSLHNFCFTNGLHSFGLQRKDHGFRYREWAPAALAVSLVGDFNAWDPNRHPCSRTGNGVFETFVHDLPDGTPAVRPGMRYKAVVHIRGQGAKTANVIETRVPAWAQFTSQDQFTGEMSAVVPPKDILNFAWHHPRPAPTIAPSLRVYEVHVGISSSSPLIAGWTYFRCNVLQRVVALGYTALLLMAVQEHGYYASFGYQVTSFFAPSSRFGTPAELQELIDAAHGHGLQVFVELVHSHASANSREGLHAFDGSDGQYFLDGPDGWHAVWGTRLFDFGRLEVLRFLLAQVCWFAEAYRIDGFRFDAVSTALYRHRSLHGRGRFDGGLADFFGLHSEVDVGALSYFKLVNLLAHELVRPSLLTIAEEHSGLPGLCAPVLAKGVGFDLRQAMGLPPLWERLLSAPASEPLDMALLATELCRRRDEERRLAYCECHDGSIVGGKTLAFRLMGAAMYQGMSLLAPPSESIERGMALHKMVRLLTCALGGEAYLNFMGNEFGHPEWIDFPTPANGHSLRMARRRRDLAEDPLLRYAQLQRFDAAMQALQAEHPWLDSAAPRGVDGRECAISQVKQLLWHIRGSTLFIYNFDSRMTATVRYAWQDVCVPVGVVLLESDAARFGGRERPTVIEAVPAIASAALSLRDTAGVLLVRVPPRSASVLLLHVTGNLPANRAPSGWHVTHQHTSHVDSMYENVLI